MVDEFEIRIEDGKRVLDAFHGKESVVIIPEGIKRIGGQAFSDNKLIRSVFIPGSVTNICSQSWGTGGAFSNCEKLSSIILSPGLETIESYSFTNCNSLINVDIPGSVVEIGRYAFLNCGNLKTAVIHDLIEAVDNEQNADCPSSSDYISPHELIIDDFAFSGCNKLEKLFVSKNLKSIGAFSLPLKTDVCVYVSSKLNVPQLIPKIGPIYLYLRDDSDRLIGVLYIPDLYQEEPYLQFVDQLAKGQISNLSQYDELFLRSEQAFFQKIWVALKRLQYPFQLQEKYLKLYIKYLKQNARFLIPQLIESMDTASMSIISEANAILPEDIDNYIDQASLLPEIEIKAILMDHKNRIRDLVRPFSLDEVEKKTPLPLWESDENEDGTLTLTRFNGTSTEINIPSSIDGKRVKKIEGRTGSLKMSLFFPNSDKVQSVTIDEGVEIIGIRAFLDCRELRSISIPSSVIEVGREAFAGCSKLTLNLPGKITTIGENAFLDIMELNIRDDRLPWMCPPKLDLNKTYINLIDKDEVIKVRLYIPECEQPRLSDEENQYIDFVYKFICGETSQLSAFDQLFNASSQCGMEKGKIALGRLEYPLQLIDQYREQYIQYLIDYNHLVIPSLIRENDILSIKFMVNANTISLKYIDLYIEEAGDFLRDDIYQILVDFKARRIDQYQIADIVETNPVDEWDVLKPKYLGNQLKVHIPSDVLSIDRAEGWASYIWMDNIFGEFKDQIYSVIIEDGVEVIYARTFYESRNLKYIKFPFSLKEIGADAFLGCERLVSLNLPKGLEEIGEGAFGLCNSLTRVQIPEGVKSIAARTFSGCKNLVSVQLPNGMKSICEDAFLHCQSLSTLFIPGSVKEIYITWEEHTCETLKSTPFTGCPNLVIHAPRGSSVIKFAKDYNIKFVEV